MAAPLNSNIRQVILSTTTTLLQVTPFAEISLAKIAHAASISKGTLYYYYNNKNDILFDIADKYMNQLAERLLLWTRDKAKDTSYHRLLQYVFQCGIYDKSGSLRLFLIAASLSDGNTLRLKLLQKYNKFKTMLAQAIAERRPGVDAEHTAWLLLTMMDGLLVQSQLQNEELDIDAFIARIVSTLEGMPLQ